MCIDRTSIRSNYSEDSFVSREDQTIEGIQYRNVEKYLVDGIVGESKDNIIKGQYEKSIAIVKSRRK